MGWIAFFLGEKQYQQISVGDGTGVGRARSLMEFNEKCPDFPDSGPSSRRHASVESESCDLVPVPASGIQSEECDGVQESGGAGTRSCASSRPARWQRGGQRVQRRKRAAAVAEIRTGGSWTSTPLASMSQQAPDHVHNSARSATTRPVKSFKQCHKIRQEQSPDGRLPPSLTCSENRLETLARRVEGLLRKRLEVIRSQARDFKECARRVRWTWHFAKNRLRLRGFVLDTTFGPRCDVAKPLVLTRIRQDVSAGRCPSQTCFIVLPDLGFWKTHVIRGCGTCQKSKPLRRSLARPGPRPIIVFLVHNTESELYFWFGNVGSRDLQVLLANVLGRVDVAVFQDKTYLSEGFRITLRILFSPWPHPPSPFVFRACHCYHHERSTFAENTPFAWNE